MQTQQLPSSRMSELGRMRRRRGIWRRSPVMNACSALRSCWFWLGRDSDSTYATPKDILAQPALWWIVKGHLVLEWSIGKITSEHWCWRLRLNKEEIRGWIMLQLKHPVELHFQEIRSTKAQLHWMLLHAINSEK